MWFLIRMDKLLLLPLLLGTLLLGEGEIRAGWSLPPHRTRGRHQTHNGCARLDVIEHSTG